MTVDFVAVDDAPQPAVDRDDAAPAMQDAGVHDAGAGSDLDASEVTADGLEAGPDLRVPEAEPCAERSSDGDGTHVLDVDTETLSALIDARLAEPESHVEGGTSEVWRVVADGPVAAPSIDPTRQVAEVPQAATGAGRVATPVDDADVLQGLPSLEEWQLVDAQPLATPVTRDTRVEPDVTLDFGGLELLPMDSLATAAAERQADPIERWMDAGHGRPPDAANDAKSLAPGTRGGRA